MPDNKDGFGPNSLGPRRNQATPGNHRHIVGNDSEGYISETLFDPATDIINGSYSGTAFDQLLEILEKYGITNEATKILGSGNWKWTDALSGDPGIGYVGGDAALLENITLLRVSKTSNGGQTLTGANLQSGDLFVILGAEAGAGYEIVTITDNGTWLLVEVNHGRGSGNPVDQEIMTIGFYPGATGHEHAEYLEPSEVLAGTAISVVESPPGSVVITNLEPGVKDHGELTGLTDNDHPQYADVDHSHPVVEGAKWTYKTVYSISDPGSGFFHTNQAGLSATTILAISVLTEGDIDVTSEFIKVLKDDIFFLQDLDNADLYVRYNVSGPPTDHGTWFEFPVEFVAIGTGSQFTNNASILIQITMNSGGGGGTGGVEETYYSINPPVDPAVADVWMDADGISAYPQTHPVPTGAIMYYASATLPVGWLPCDGRAVDRGAYGALFLICGTTFGAGNGATTFNLPNLISKFARGAASPGGIGGANTHAHPGTGWATGNSDVGRTNNNDAAPDGTGNANAAPEGTGNAGAHDHGTSAAGGHAHGISDASHNHGGTGTQSGTFGASGGGTGVTKSHSHSISSASHNHGGTNSQSDHGHGRTGENSGHSHGIPGSVHSHGVPGSNHDHGIAGANHSHNIPASTDESNVPAYLNVVAMIYTGV